MKKNKGSRTSTGDIFRFDSDTANHFYDNQGAIQPLAQTCGISDLCLPINYDFIQSDIENRRGTRFTIQRAKLSNGIYVVNVVGVALI